MIFTFTQATESVASHDENYKLAKYTLRLTDNIVAEIKSYLFDLARNHTSPEIVSKFHNKDAFDKLKNELFSAIQKLFNYEQIKSFVHAEDVSLDLFEAYSMLHCYFANSNPIYATLFSDLKDNELPNNEDLYEDKF